MKRLLYTCLLGSLAVCCHPAAYGSISFKCDKPLATATHKRPALHILLSAKNHTKPMPAHFKPILSPSFIACWLYEGSPHSGSVPKDIYNLVISCFGHEIYGTQDISKPFGLRSSIFVRERLIYFATKSSLLKDNHKVFRHFLPKYFTRLTHKGMQYMVLERLIQHIQQVTPEKSIVAVQSARILCECHFFTHQGKCAVLVLKCNTSVSTKSEWTYHKLDLVTQNPYKLAGIFVKVPPKESMLDMGKLFPQPLIYHTEWHLGFTQCTSKHKIKLKDKSSIRQVILNTAQEDLKIYPYAKSLGDGESFLLVIDKGQTNQPAWILDVRQTVNRKEYKVTHVYHYSKNNSIKLHTLGILYALSWARHHVRRY